MRGNRKMRSRGRFRAMWLEPLGSLTPVKTS